MTTTVNFLDTEGNAIGQITVTDSGELRADPGLESVTRAWRAQGKSPAEFAKYYDGWSNGQVIARIQGEENTVVTTPKMGSGARFKKLAARAAGAKSGADEPDADDAPTARKKKFGAGKFARLAAKKQQSE